MKRIGLIFTFILILFQSLQAGEVNYLGRSPTALLMGDAFTALADDGYTLYYNPAALGRNQGVQFSLLNPKIGITNPGVSYSNPTGDIDKFSDTDTSDPVAIAEEFVDYPIYLEMGLWPTLKFGPFGISAFTNVTNSLMIKNAVHPIFDINYKRDNGVIFGYAQRFGSAAEGGYSLLSLGQGHLFSVGASLKYIQRESIKAQYDVFGPTLLGQISGGQFDDISDVKSMLGYAIGKGYGADVGVEYSLIGERTQFTTGFSIMDLGGTLFKKSEGPGEIDRQEMRMNFGTAFSQDFYIIDYRAAFDIHPINDDTLEFSSKLHFGLDVGMPLFRVLMGYNAGYISYGIKMNLWPVELIVGLYGIETGYRYRQREAKRAVIYLSLLDFSIDA